MFGCQRNQRMYLRVSMSCSLWFNSLLDIRTDSIDCGDCVCEMSEIPMLAATCNVYKLHQPWLHEECVVYRVCSKLCAWSEYYHCKSRTKFLNIQLTLLIVLCTILGEIVEGLRQFGGVGECCPTVESGIIVLCLLPLARDSLMSTWSPESS